MSDKKYLVRLRSGTRDAVVIDISPVNTKLRALMTDPQGGWIDSTVEIITRVRRSRMNRVLAIERHI
jgi:hypothetical protein